MTLKYRLILLVATLIAVLAYQMAFAAQNFTKPTPEENSVVEYKTLLFVLDGIDSNETVHTIDKFIDEYYVDWNRLYKGFNEQVRKKFIPKKRKKT